MSDEGKLIKVSRLKVSEAFLFLDLVAWAFSKLLLWIGLEIAAIVSLDRDASIAVQARSLYS